MSCSSCADVRFARKSRVMRSQSSRASQIGQARHDESPNSHEPGSLSEFDLLDEQVSGEPCKKVALQGQDARLQDTATTCRSTRSSSSWLHYYHLHTLHCTVQVVVPSFHAKPNFHPSFGGTEVRSSVITNHSVGPILSVRLIICFLHLLAKITLHSITPQSGTYSIVRSISFGHCWTSS